MNAETPSPDPAPDVPPGETAPTEKPDQAKKPRRHILGLPPGYKFDSAADNLRGFAACFGDDVPPGATITMP